MSELIQSARGWTAGHMWVWPFGAATLLWLADCALSGHVSAQLLLVNATLATFLALAGIAQMVVIASGDGSFDLSLPYVITLSAFLSAGVLGGGHRRILYGIIAALLGGLLIGLCNAFLTAFLKMPAIVASLATGYIVYTIILRFEKKGEGVVSAGLGGFLRRQADGASVILGLGLMGGAIMAFLLTRTVYGSYLHGMGQNRMAARFAGIGIPRMMVFNFAISGVMGATIGILLAAYDGGAFQDIGSVYLLGSVAAVVVGGTPVSGGKSSVPATMFGALVMTLLVTALEITKLSAGIQDIVEGLVVIVIVMIPALAYRARNSER